MGAPHVRVWFKSFYDKETLIGTAAFYSRQKIDYASLFPIEIIGQELLFLMRLRFLYTQCESRTMIDPITGAYNAHYFMRTMERELHRAKRYEIDLTLMLIDFCNLPELIQTWESKFSRTTNMDDLMPQVTQLLHDSVRRSDIVALVDNHQFAIILPETDLENAEKVAERIRANLLHHCCRIGEEDLQLTVRMGMVGYLRTL